MQPPKQSLIALYLRGFQIHYRLVVQTQLLALQRLAQIVLEYFAVLKFTVYAGIEETVSRHHQLFCPYESKVGIS
jgi:hypothetical protein